MEIILKSQTLVWCTFQNN